MAAFTSLQIFKNLTAMRASAFQRYFAIELESKRTIHTGVASFAHPNAIYEEILELPNQPYKLLIDVRRSEDFKEFGSIPGAINIPCELIRF